MALLDLYSHIHETLDQSFAWRLAAGYDYLPRWSREVPNGRADIRTGVGDQVESSRTIRRALISGFSTCEVKMMSEPGVEE